MGGPANHWSGCTASDSPAPVGRDRREAQEVKRFRISFDLRTVKARAVASGVSVITQDGKAYLESE